MSMLVQHSPAGNSLIAALPRADRVRVIDACEPARLAFGATIYEAEIQSLTSIFRRAGTFP
jgi:hypothetical protein